MIVRTGEREFAQLPPLAWELDGRGERRELPSAFRELPRERFGFDVTGRDLGRSLVIDPVLVYSETVGGSGADAARDVYVDADGAAYVVGWAKSSDFPGVPRRPHGKDVAVFKLDAAGKELGVRDLPRGIR